LTSTLLIIGVLIINFQMIRMINKLSREIGGNDVALKKQRKYYEKEGRVQEVLSKPNANFDELAVIIDSMRTPKPK